MDEELKHGTVTDTASKSVDVRPLDRVTVVAGVREAVNTSLGTLPTAAIVVGVVIIATGAVVGLLLFIWLCFRYPDSANAWIPTITTALIPVLVKAWIDSCAAERKKIEDGKTGIVE